MTKESPIRTIAQNVFLGKYFLFVLASEEAPVTSLKKDPRTNVFTDHLFLKPEALLRHEGVFEFYEKLFTPEKRPNRESALLLEKDGNLIFFDTEKDSRVIYLRKESHLLARSSSKSGVKEMNLPMGLQPPLEVNRDFESVLFGPPYESLPPAKDASFSFRQEQGTWFFETRAMPFLAFCRRCYSYLPTRKPEIHTEEKKEIYVPFSSVLNYKELDFVDLKKVILGSMPRDSKRSGLEHLLNILRLGKVDEEITVMKNLYKEDSAFAKSLEDQVFDPRLLALLLPRYVEKILRLLSDEEIALLFYTASKNRPFLQKGLSRGRAARILTLPLPPPKVWEKTLTSIRSVTQSVLKKHEGILLAKNQLHFRTYETENTSASFSIEDHRGPFFIWLKENEKVLRLPLPQISRFNCRRFFYELKGGRPIVPLGATEHSLNLFFPYALNYIRLAFLYTRLGEEDSLEFSFLPAQKIIEIPLRAPVFNLVYFVYYPSSEMAEGEIRLSFI